MTTSVTPARGIALGIVAQLIWGLAPLYWIQTMPVSAVDLVAHRVLWSIPFLMLWLAFAGQLTAALGKLTDFSLLWRLALGALLVSLNWGIFLWAVTHQQATDASLGYFLLPLVSIAIGLLVFRETLGIAQWLAVICALAAIVLLSVAGDGVPLVALGVALSFGVYGAIRKAIAIDSVAGLLLEMLLLLPLAAGWVLYQGGAGFGKHGLQVDAFLLGAGVMTALPLMAYVTASRLMPLSLLGLVSYVGPTTQLLVAICLLGEQVAEPQQMAFALVWLGLALASLNSLRRRRPVG